MNWSRQNNSRSVLVTVTILVLLIYGYDFRTEGSVRSAVRAFSIPVHDLVISPLRNLRVGGFFSRNSALVTENTLLKARVLELETTATAYKALSSSFQNLSNEARLPRGTTGVTARIITRPSLSPYGTFLVAIEKGQGVQNGFVVSTQGVVLGTVVDTHDTHAQVELLFAPDRLIAGSVHGVSVTLRGYGGANAHAEAPRGSAIQVGDVMSAPELGWRPIGIVRSVTDDSSQSSIRVIVRPAVNIDAIEFVTIESL